MHGRSGAAGGRDAAAATCAARLEELHVVGDDLGDAALLAVLALPGAGLDAALDEDERTLARVLRHGLGQVSLADGVRHDVVVVSELLALAVRAGRPPVGGDAE